MNGKRWELSGISSSLVVILGSTSLSVLATQNQGKAQTPIAPTVGMPDEVDYSTSMFASSEAQRSLSGDSREQFVQTEARSQLRNDVNSAALLMPLSEQTTLSPALTLSGSTFPNLFPSALGSEFNANQEWPGTAPTYDLAQETRIPDPYDPHEFKFRVIGGSNDAKGFHGGFGVLIPVLDREFIGFAVEGGERTFGYDLSFTDPGNVGGIGYRVHVFSRRSPDGIYLNGDREVELRHDHLPWIHRTGGGLELLGNVGRRWVLSGGLTYQRISFRNAAFSDSLYPEDEFGNALSFSEDGQDDLFTVNFRAVQDLLDDPDSPTRGSKIEFGMDQALPIGIGEIVFNRLRASYTQFLPLGSESAFVFNVQGGTIIGDKPGYEGFALGGSNSVRGYGTGELGTGSSYVQATTELRFPLIADLRLPVVSRVAGVLFADFGSDLDTGDELRGEPAEVRQKPGDGFGFGAGLRIDSDFGPLRIEFGINDEGDGQVHFGIGERF